MKVITIVGARPQFIKAAAVSRAMNNVYGIKEVIVHTGQHYDQNMSDVFFEELKIPKPDYQLGVGGSSHGSMTGQMLEKIEAVILKENPNVVLVYGDTNSTLAGALAASKLNIPVAHVEAGLRSFNKRMPEEQNRILTDHLSSILFTPSKLANENLSNEGIGGKQVKMIGDVMADVAKFYSTHETVLNGSILEKHLLSKSNFVLATIHRAENTDDLVKLTNIVDAMTQISDYIPVIFPLHPRTRRKLEESDLLKKLSKNVKLTPPLGYLEMVTLEKEARLIVTDSGGVQKEAYFHQTPCITLREETEWLELVKIGVNKLIAPDNVEEIVKTITRGLEEKVDFNSASLYGLGDASEKIVSSIINFIEESKAS